MADFGTIINKENNTLTLYCNNVVASNPVYLYASAPFFYYTTNEIKPIIFNDIIGREITASNFPKITVSNSGVYKISCNLLGRNSAMSASTYDLNLFLSFNLYDSNGTFISSSLTSGVNFYNFVSASIQRTVPLALDAIMKIDKDQYLEVVVSTLAPPPSFEVYFSSGTLCISLIGTN